MGSPGHIVVADENPVLVSSIAGLLTDRLSVDPEEIAEVAPIRTRTVIDANPNLLILDPLLTESLPRFVDAVRQATPGVSFVAYASRPTLELARYCLEMGFRAFLPKTMAPTSFVSAIRVVMDGGTFIHKSFVRQMRDIDMNDTAAPALSEREETTLRMVALGYSNREIAAHLALSAKTVDTHRARAMRKLDINAKPDLVRVACARGWLF